MNSDSLLDDRQFFCRASPRTTYYGFPTRALPHLNCSRELRCCLICARARQARHESQCAVDRTGRDMDDLQCETRLNIAQKKDGHDASRRLVCWSSNGRPLYILVKIGGTLSFRDWWMAARPMTWKIVPRAPSRSPC